MKPILIILAIVLIAVAIILIVRMYRKAVKENAAFEAEYGKFVGRVVWRTSFQFDEFFDEQKNIIAELTDFYGHHFCDGNLPEFFPCKITKIEQRYYDKKCKGRIYVVPLPFEADFEIKYISTTHAILYSEKYGELQLNDRKLYKAIKNHTSPTIRLKCDPFITPDPPKYGYIEFIICWEIVSKSN